MMRLTAPGCLLAVAIMASPAPSDEAAIRSARGRSNRAIAAHDLDSAAVIWSANYVGVSSRNDRAVGRDEERRQMAGIFASRPEVVFVRTPTSIAVNAQWAQAGENGRWTGKWSGPDGVTRVGGSAWHAHRGGLPQPQLAPVRLSTERPRRGRVGADRHRARRAGDGRRRCGRNRRAIRRVAVGISLRRGDR